MCTHYLQVVCTVYYSTIIIQQVIHLAISHFISHHLLLHCDRCCMCCKGALKSNTLALASPHRLMKKAAGSILCIAQSSVIPFFSRKCDPVRAMNFCISWLLYLLLSQACTELLPLCMCNRILFRGKRYFTERIQNSKCECTEVILCMP